MTGGKSCEPDLTADQKSLKAAAEAGAAPAHGTLGSAFNRAHPKGSKQKQAYEACQGKKAKELFRKQWAKLEWDSVQAEFKTLDFESHTDGNKGTYLPFRVVWEREGLDRAGYVAFHLA